MAVLGVGRGPTGLVARLRFKWLDSQLKWSNMGLIWIDLHDFYDFQKSCGGFRTGYYRIFGSCASTFAFSSFSVGIKKMRDEQLCRFVVVSPRGVPCLTFSWPFEMFDFP